MVENIGIALKILTDDGVKLVNIGEWFIKFKLYYLWSLGLVHNLSSHKKIGVIFNNLICSNRHA